MSTETIEPQEEIVANDEEQAQQKPQYALLFELDNVALSGRQAAFDLLKNLLSDKKVSLAEHQFSRYGLYPSPEYFVPRMLEGLELNKVSADKLCDDLRSGLDMHYSARDIQISPALMAIIEGALERGIEVAAICAMPEKTAETVMKNTGLADKGVQLFSYDDVEETFPRADIWMKIANSLSIGTRCCLVLASSAVACKSALSAGMRCLALPDVFTAFQDFGGAEQVMDDLGEVPTNELLDTLFPA